MPNPNPPYLIPPPADFPLDLEELLTEDDFPPCEEE